MLEGDENSSFFHGLMNMNIKNSRINGLNKNGVWISNPDIIKNEVFNFFKNKFKENVTCRPQFTSSKFHTLEDHDRTFLEEPFTMDEIKSAVWGCGNDKCPGPDGFLFKFINTFWDIIRDDVVEGVKFFEQHKVLNSGSNTSFISLIPKSKDPLNLTEYRPINLIGCITKIISKCLASRLKKGYWFCGKMRAIGLC